jgi:hypothetical protein
VNLDNVTREEQIVGGLALLLAIFLLILPWFDVSVGPFSATFSATSAPDGWLGILAFIAALALLADLAIERFAPQTQIPAVGTRPNTRFILAVAAAAFLLLKFLFHINHFSDLGWGFYVDVIVTAALVYFAMKLRNATAPVGAGRPARPVTPTPGAGSTPSTGAGPVSPDPGTTPGSGTVPPEGPGGSTPPPRV